MIPRFFLNGITTRPVNVEKLSLLGITPKIVIFFYFGVFVFKDLEAWRSETVSIKLGDSRVSNFSFPL